MKPLLLIALLATLMAAPVLAGDPPGSGTVIEAVRAVGRELVVTVRVPAGRRRVTLEVRPRLQRGAWTPREVKWSDGGAGELTFKLPLGSGMEMLRVRDEAEAELGLPASFFGGLKAFAPTKQPEGSSQPPGRNGGPVDFTASPLGNTGAGLDIKVGGPSESPRSVVESDIWQVEGRTLYFFNQQRGLQVVDLADADHPILTGTLPLAVWGEQMYRLPAATADGSVWLALLAQQGCGGNGSEVLLVKIKAGRPALASRLPVRGQIKETRLVGDALYLATYDWFQPPAKELRDAQGGLTGYEYQPWESRTVISAFDLSVPARPVARPALEIAANPDAISATDAYLFIATSGSQTVTTHEVLPGWAVAGNHAVLVFDIRDPQGTVRPSGFALTAGRVADKFKLGFNGGVLTTISQTDSSRPVNQTNWFRPRHPGDPIYAGDPIWIPVPPGGRPTEPDAYFVVWPSWEWVAPRAVLETFSLANPATPVALGQLTLVTNESLFATRLAGDRAYVVTFRRVDPLWIVDLGDPAQPVVRGELPIPGYSTYLQPLADNSRLLALGVEGGRTMVQLFDVADAARPALLSKVTLGEGWSWSEGNADEKAFQVFPDAGLVLVPWQGTRSGTNPAPWFQGIQLLDLDLAAGRLRARGVVDHAVPARRATLLGDRVVSISAQELLSVNAADRDHPVVTAGLALADQVDRVFVTGDRLIELRDAGVLPAQIALAPAATPEQPLARLPLGTLPIIGADWHDGRLFVVQFRADEWRNETVTLTNSVVKQVSQPPLPQWRTNFTVIEVPPPIVKIRVTNTYIREEVELAEWTTNTVVEWREVPQPQATNEVSSSRTIHYPPSPQAPETRTVILTWLRPEFTPAPPTQETRETVTFVLLDQPPLLLTNWLTETHWQTVRVPGESRFSIVDVGAGTLRLASQLQFENPDDFYGASLTPVWSGADTVVWTERPNGYGWSEGWFRGGVGIVGQPGFGGAGRSDLAFRPGFGGGGWWGNETRNFLAFDVSAPAAPKLASRTRLGGTNEWNSFSETFAADGKLFVGHRVSKYIPAPETTTLVTNLDGTITKLPVWQPGTWEHRQFLDVLDFADAAEPVVRPPLAIPGSLGGVALDGRLVYATGEDPQAPDATSAPQLHALAYDGVQASLVASLPLPAAGPQPLLVRPDGQVFLGRPAATTNDRPALETWAVSTAGKFEQYATTVLAAPAEELHAFGDLLVVPAGEAFQFFGATAAPGLRALGAGERPCSLWFDWSRADTSSATGLWIPRGPPGLWQVPLQP